MKKSLLCIFLFQTALHLSAQNPYPIAHSSVTGNACNNFSYNREANVRVTAVAAGNTLTLTPQGGIAPAITDSDPAAATAEFDISAVMRNVPQGSPATFVLQNTNTNTTPPTVTQCTFTITNNYVPPTPSIVYSSLDQMVYDQYNFGLYFNRKRNLYIKDNVVHIFMDGEGRLIITGTPTAIQENYTYQLHVFAGPNAKIKFTGSGDYKPEFLNIQVSSVGASAISSDGAANEEVHEYPSPLFGPYTSSFTLKVVNDKDLIFNNTFTPAKRYHLSIVTGLLGTNLNNPQNIEIADKKDGSGKTLIADDPEWRGMMSVMAVFYPTPRSFLFQPDNLWERTGFVVGTRIDKNVFENLLAGVQVEFARGGSITSGVHFGQRTFIPGYKNFRFGEDTYNGTTVVTKKEWDLGWFVGINLDLKILQYFLTGGANPK